MSLTARETATYEDVLSLPAYAVHSPGEQYADMFASLATPGATVLDAGCGTGKGMVALRARGFDVDGCDLTDVGLVQEARGRQFVSGVCLWRPLGPQLGAVRFRHDYVYCTDVLEHVPPTMTMLVVRNLLDAAERGVFLSISLVPDHMGVWVGKSLHQSVRRYDEWLADLRELARVTDARDLGGSATFFLEPLR
jgi:2-polyprenyl-3-methyl-5-hydroxy-6-metoxy-1,4-benzoquinol methylase